MKNLKTYFVVSLLAFSSFATASGIPTVDIVGNIRGALQLAQDTINAIETKVQSVQQITQIKNEIEMITNQVEQAERELRNLANLDSFRFSDVKAQLQILNNAANRAGSLTFATGMLKENYERYKNSDYYNNNAIAIDKAVFEDARKRWNDDQINTAKASADVLQSQSNILNSDAEQLSKLNDDVEDIDGAVQAQQAGNQLQSFTASQLLHLRTLLMNQQQMQIQEKAQTAEEMALQRAAFDRATQYSAPTKPAKNY